MAAQIDARTPSLEPKLVGIGGWLILPAIGLVLGIIRSVVSLITSMTLFSDVEEAGYGGLFFFEFLVELGFLVFFIYAATRFFGKRRNAPATMIGLMTTSIIVTGLLLMIEQGVDAEPFVVESTKQLVQGIVGAVIWIPYFRVSKRVKATFVNW